MEMILLIRVVVITVLAAALPWILLSTACACDVPVSQYALENWPPFVYEVIIAHQGELPADTEKVLHQLHELSAEESGRANFCVRTADMAGNPGERVLKLWQSAGKPVEPCILLASPQFHDTATIVWSNECSEEAVRVLSDSPVRRQIVRHLLEGAAAVWVLLPSGDAKKDSAAELLITACLKEAEDKLNSEAEGNMPEPLSTNTGVEESSPNNPITNSPPVDVRFSLLRVSRTDPAESALVAMLEHCEPDLKQYASEPIVLPVFGRGRMLYALVGKGITADNIDRACQFLTGPCSCTIKEQNPGMDMLLSVDWEARLGDRVGDADEPQPLFGLSTLMAADTRQVSSGEPDNAKQPAPSNTFLRAILIAVVTIVVISVLLALFIIRHFSRKQP